jgi:hypothetical protein
MDQSGNDATPQPEVAKGATEAATGAAIEEELEATVSTMTNWYRRLTRNLEQHAQSAEGAFELANFRRVLRVYDCRRPSVSGIVTDCTSSGHTSLSNSQHAGQSRGQPTQPTKPCERRYHAGSV